MIKSLGNKTFRLGDRQLDLELWQKLYYKCQQEYLRKRLLAIKYLYEGKTRTEVSDLLDCHYKTLSTWIDIVIPNKNGILFQPKLFHSKKILSQSKSE